MAVTAVLYSDTVTNRISSYNIYDYFVKTEEAKSEDFNMKILTSLGLGRSLRESIGLM